MSLGFVPPPSPNNPAPSPSAGFAAANAANTPAGLRDSQSSASLASQAAERAERSERVGNPSSLLFDADDFSNTRNRPDLPVLSVSLKLLQGLFKQLQREADLTSNPTDLGILV